MEGGGNGRGEGRAAQVGGGDLAVAPDENGEWDALRAVFHAERDVGIERLRPGHAVRGQICFHFSDVGGLVIADADNVKALRVQFLK